MKNNVEKKLVVVDFKGPLSELGGISGPITNPVKLEIPIIIKMITAHRGVFEVNPKNTSERVLLTLQNVKLKNFHNVESKTTLKPEPVVNKSSNNSTDNKPVIKDDFSKKDKKGDFTKK